jgi:2-methylisocitrate lyase-like PEP mutase family enzyme
MAGKATLRELLQRENILAPCVFDCASARAVELCGYKGMMLSGAELCMASKGMPDLGLLSLDEMLWAVTRITDVSPLPLAVDIEDGFGGPLNVYHTCERMAKAGAAAVLLEDEAEPGFARGVVRDNILPREAYYAKVKAAVAALKGSDCLLIARTNVDLKRLEEGIERCLGALEAGAEMTVIVRLNNLKDAKEVSKRVPGWKMYPDLNQDMDVPEVAVEDVYALGFNFVTMHYLMKAAMAGMIEYGRQNLANNNNVYSNHQRPCGVPGQSGMPFFEPQKWLDFEGTFTGKPVKYNGPKLDLTR